MSELLELVKVAPERHRAVVLTTGLAGPRQGELLAFRRGDIDLDHSVVPTAPRIQSKDLAVSPGSATYDD